MAIEKSRSGAAMAAKLAEADHRLPVALYRDPAPNRQRPAQTLAQAIPSHGVNLNAILYTAGGAGPHATILLLHGLPGNEQNVDLAQSMRRAGWNVLTLHYRGSWGGLGDFTFAHCLEDAFAALDWLQAAGDDPALTIDPERIVVIGHSMGGFVAAHLAAERHEILGAVLISAVDLGSSFGGADTGRAVAIVDDNVGTGAGLHILSGTSPGSLAREAQAYGDGWRLTDCAGRLTDRPLLIITSEDGFAAAGDGLARAAAGDRLSQAHFATDHSYSDCRIGLQTVILDWLTGALAGFSS